MNHELIPPPGSKPIESRLPEAPLTSAPELVKPHNHSPLVTVVIPCFNNSQWLQSAISSALSQTHSPVEVIVVDDGSTDTSLVLASAYGDRIILRRTAHRGATNARNEGVKDSHGEWIQFLDADDYLHPDKIAHQLAEAEGGADADVIYSPVVIETIRGDSSKQEQSTLDLSRDLYCQWLSWELPQTGGALWRRSALEALGGWRRDQPCCQEHELYLRALKAGLRFKPTPTAGAVYRIWSEETLCRKDPRLVIATKTRLIDDLRQWMEAKKLWKPIHTKTAARACFEMARTIAKYDISQAASYYSERKSKGLISVEGPAAPSTYRTLQRLLGFRAAELAARLMRRK